MANTKISALSADTAPTADDLVVTVNDPGGTPATRKATITNFTKAIPAVVGDSGSGGTKGLVPAPAAGDAAALKFLKADGTWTAPAGGSGGLGDVVGPSTSVDSEIALFNSTTGKLIKRASTTGLLKAASGVIAAAVAGTDYVIPTAVMNDQTGTTYTLQASDNGKVVTCSNASPVAVTVPSGLGAGFNCMVVQKGAGQVSFTASSTTINNRQSHLKITGQFGVASLVAYEADVFVLGGDTAA